MNAAQSPDQIYQRNESYVFRKIEEETILVPIKDNVGDMGLIYTLNDVGAFIWQLLDGDRSLQEIKALVTEAFEVSALQAESDLNEFVDELKEIAAIQEIL